MTDATVKMFCMLLLIRQNLYEHDINLRYVKYVEY